MALPDFSMRQLLEAGCHFGHQTHRWNPKMKDFIFGERSNIHIIDLSQTVPLLHQALVKVRETAAKGGRVLFVGTKRQASEPLALAAGRCAQYYMNQRWLGGTLTNWRTISQSIARLRELQGTAEEALANPELMQLMLPILRADFLLCGSFTYGERAPLGMPIHVFGGKQDSVRADQLLDWQLDAASGFSLDMFDGHHFFLMQHESAVLRCMRRYADEHLARWRNGAARQLARASG